MWHPGKRQGRGGDPPRPPLSRVPSYYTAPGLTGRQAPPGTGDARPPPPLLVYIRPAQPWAISINRVRQHWLLFSWKGGVDMSSLAVSVNRMLTAEGQVPGLTAGRCRTLTCMVIKQNLGNRCLPRSQLIIWWGRCYMQISHTDLCGAASHPPPVDWAGESFVKSPSVRL